MDRVAKVACTNGGNRSPCSSAEDVRTSASARDLVIACRVRYCASATDAEGLVRSPSRARSTGCAKSAPCCRSNGGKTIPLRETSIAVPTVTARLPYDLTAGSSRTPSTSSCADTSLRVTQTSNRTFAAPRRPTGLRPLRPLAASGPTASTLCVRRGWQRGWQASQKDRECERSNRIHALLRRY